VHNVLRISGGEFRGRQLKAPRGDATRPTSDMVRQAIFNLLGQTLDVDLVLDVFCGSGAMGIEALSRGAQRAWMVDKSPHAVEATRHNVALVGVASRATVLQGAATASLLRLPAGGAQLALVDPPYAFSDRGPLLAALAHALAKGATLVFETAEDDELAEPAAPFERTDHRTYGGTGVHILTRN
jgi:16S rRNA (guanine966-N2)-methyltransferase